MITVPWELKSLGYIIKLIMNHKDNKENVSLVPRKKYADPRALQIDVNMPLVWCYGKEGWSGTSENENRVMPFRDLEKFLKVLRRKTATIKDIDESHFWVSGYIALYFYMKSKEDRARTKKIVQEALEESGGFMSWEEWLEKHNKPRTRIYQYNGTGSGITGGLVNTETIAFL